MSDRKPRGRPDVLTRSTRRQRMLYDRSSNTFHELNETAEFIWGLCDGTNTIEKIEQKLREHFDVPGNADVRGDIQRTLSTLNKKGLLQES